MAKQTYGLSDELDLAKIPAPDLPYGLCDPKAYNPPIGLIGCGGISQSHLRAYKAAGYNVVALCDCDAARAAARRKEFYPRAAVFTDPAELLKRDDCKRGLATLCIGGGMGVATVWEKV